MQAISSLRETVSLKVNGSNEIVSVGQARYLIQKAESSGCTPECLACHFSELYLRDLHPDQIESILDGEYERTDLPSHGAQIIDIYRNDLRMGVVSIPDGIYFKVISMYNDHDAAVICLLVKDRWNVPMTVHRIDDIADHFTDNLPRTEDGQPMIPEIVDAAPHPGVHLTQLPTAPVSPRNHGRPRTSFSRPPPVYSPRPSFRGLDLRHPREVISEDGHYAPFFPIDRAPSAPVYDRTGGTPFMPPAYSSPLQQGLRERYGSGTGLCGPVDTPIPLSQMPTSPISPLDLSGTTSHIGTRPQSERQSEARPTSQAQSRSHGPLRASVQVQMPADMRRPSFALTRQRAHAGAPLSTANLHLLSRVSRPSAASRPAIDDNSASLSSPQTRDGMDSRMVTCDTQEYAPRTGHTPPASSPTPSSTLMSSFPYTFLDTTSELSPQDAAVVDIGVKTQEVGDATNMSGSSESSTDRAAHNPNPDVFRFVHECDVGETLLTPHIMIILVETEDGVQHFRAFGGIARAILNTYPWRYRALSLHEFEEAATEIDHLRSQLDSQYSEPDFPEPEPDHSNIPDLSLGIASPWDTFEDENPRPLSRMEDFVRAALEEMLRRDPMSYDYFTVLGERDTAELDRVCSALVDLQSHREVRALDHITEANALKIRKKVATAMDDVDYASVLVPYNLEAHLQAGKFHHEPNFLVSDPRHAIDTFLLKLPTELDIFTETPQRLPIPHGDPEIRAGMARNPEYELPSQRLTDPFEELEPYQQHVVQLDIAYEVTNEIINAYEDGYLEAVVAGYLNLDRPMDIDTLRAVLYTVRNLRKKNIPLETVKSVLLNQEVPSEYFDPLLSPTSEDILAVPLKTPIISGIARHNRAVFKSFLAQFPPDTRWTTSLVKGVESALKIAVQDDDASKQDSKVRATLDGCVLRVRDVLQREEDSGASYVAVMVEVWGRDSSKALAAAARVAERLKKSETQSPLKGLLALRSRLTEERWLNATEVEECKREVARAKRWHNRRMQPRPRGDSAIQPQLGNSGGRGERREGGRQETMRDQM